MGSLGDTLTRLSTGLRINSGKDDPAGLIASELLKSQITSTNKAISNTQRANSLIATADSAMNQIGNLLNDVKGLVVESANTGTMTTAQIAANQMQVDAALDSIDRIARTTNYGGKRILDGALDFQTAGMDGAITNLQISNANFGTSSAVGVDVNVQQTADYARLISNGTGVGVDTIIDIIGNRGSSTVNIGGGSSNDDIAAAINRSTDSTGVLAYVEGKEGTGSVTLSSAGANNDIVITAVAAGLDAGDFDFRITRGDTNDVRIVSEPDRDGPGIVEISLKSATQSNYGNFAGLFDISIDTTNRDNPATATTSITMQQGNANRVEYATQDRAANTNNIGSKTLSATATDANGQNVNSQLNGWTVAVDNSLATAAGSERMDTTTKTIYVNTASFEQDAAGNATFLNNAVKNALANSTDGSIADFDAKFAVDVSVMGQNFANGDRFTFGSGAAEGELIITYASGTTANDMLAMINNAPNVAASLANGVNGNSVIPNQPNGLTRVSSSENVESRFSSGVTSQEVIDLINSKLGYMFKAEGLTVDGGTGGRVSFMDASAVHGDINMGNALRFTGMDNGPVVRLNTLGTNGQSVANQQLSVNLIRPGEADIKAGIHTPILEINLATDAQGNSITTAEDIATLFNSLTAEQTMGVSVAQLFPPGVDPNASAGSANGIVQPTTAMGTRGPEGDIVLLGGNQSITADNAVARIDGHNRPTPTEGPTEFWTTAANNPAVPAGDTRIQLGTTSFDAFQALGSDDDGAYTGIRLIGNLAADATRSSSADVAAFLEGMHFAIAVAGDPGDPVTATFGLTGASDDPTITFTIGESDDLTVGAIATALNNLFSLGTGLSNYNDWAEENGREPLTDPGTNPLNRPTFHASHFGLDNLTSGDSTAADAEFGDAMKSAAIEPDMGTPAQPGPSFMFSEEHAEMLDGVTIRFVENTGATAPPLDATAWNEATNTLTIGLGWNASGGGSAITSLGGDALKARVNEALSTEAIFNAMQTSLGWDEDLTYEDDAPEALLVRGPAARATSSSTMDLEASTEPTFSAITGAVPASSGVTSTPTDTTSTTEFRFNDSIFTVTATGTAGEDTRAFDIRFGTGATAWTAASGDDPAILTIDVSDFRTGTAGSVTDIAGDTAEAFAAFVNSKIAAANASDALFGNPNANPPVASPAGKPANVTGITFAVANNNPGPDSWNNAGVINDATALVAAWNNADDHATAPGIDGVSIAAGTAVPQDASGQTILSFGETSAMNGMTFAFTRDETQEGFNDATGTLTIFLGSEFEALQSAVANGNDSGQADAALRSAVNGAIAANWEGIRAFTGGTTNTSVTDPVKLIDSQHESFTVANALRDAANADNPFAMAGDGKTMISGSHVEGAVVGQRGIGIDDAVLAITAKEAGTHMAGINVHFVNDAQNAGLK
ncbi:MAG: hypothetical protein FWG73_02805, partial [Planctomycetaceae bacterium]|nr:hypothetical protein [Planctomycetaceae bacterium]